MMHFEQSEAFQLSYVSLDAHKPTYLEQAWLGSGVSISDRIRRGCL